MRSSDGRLARPSAAEWPGGDSQRSTINATRSILGFCEEQRGRRARQDHHEDRPMKIVSAAEMREIDRATSERFGVPSITLMENAGAAVARFVVSDYPQAERIAVICGKGNNGGDGFVAARKLIDAGRAVRVLLLCDPKDLRGDAAAMFQNLLQTFTTSGLAPS